MRGRVPATLALAALVAAARRAAVAPRALGNQRRRRGPVVAWAAVMSGFEMPPLLSRMPLWAALVAAARRAAVAPRALGESAAPAGPVVAWRQ